MSNARSHEANADSNRDGDSPASITRAQLAHAHKLAGGALFDLCRALRYLSFDDTDNEARASIWYAIGDLQEIVDELAVPSGRSALRPPGAPAWSATSATAPSSCAWSLTCAGALGERRRRSRCSLARPVGRGWPGDSGVALGA